MFGIIKTDKNIINTVVGPNKKLRDTVMAKRNWKKVKNIVSGTSAFLKSSKTDSFYYRICSSITFWVSYYGGLKSYSCFMEKSYEP